MSKMKTCNDCIHADECEKDPNIPEFNRNNLAYCRSFEERKASDWISVEDRLPEPEKTVLIRCRSQFSQFGYVCCGFYVPEGTYREDSGYTWDYECCNEYDEEKDDYIVNDGWYEAIHNWDDYNAVGVADIVTHWMPLPEPPKGE